jgi:hypothetical protein
MADYDSRLERAFERLDRVAALARGPIDVELRSLLEEELRPMDELATGLACNVLAGPYRGLVDSFCFEALYGFRQIAFSYIVLGILQLPLVVPTYMVWRSMRAARREAREKRLAPEGDGDSESEKTENSRNTGTSLKWRKEKKADLVLLNPEATLPYPVEKLARLIFLPGTLGLRADWAEGLVKEVVPGGQGEIAGVQVGWQFVQIDGQPYSTDLLDRRIEGSSQYVITFLKTDVPPDSKATAFSSFCTCWGPPDIDGEELEVDGGEVGPYSEPDRNHFKI